MAFPTTSVLDALGRTENPVSDGGNWSTPAFTTDATMSDTSTGAKNNSGASWCSAYRSNTTYGPDTEVYATWAVTVSGQSTELLARLQTPNTTGVDGYLLDITSGSWTTWQINNVTQTQVGPSGTQAMSNGDTYGFEVTGTGASVALKGYYKASGGSWGGSPVVSTTDSTANRVTAAGNIGMVLSPNTTQRLTNFGGGTVSAGTLDALQAVMAGTGSMAAALSVTKVLQTVMAGTGGLTPALSLSKNLQTSMDGVGGFSPSLTDTAGGAVALQASMDGSSGMASVLTLAKNLQASMDGAGAMASVLGVSKNLQAAMAGSSTMASVATVAKNLQAVMAGSSTMASAVTLAKNLQASFDGVSSMVGTISGGVASAVKTKWRLWFGMV